MAVKSGRCQRNGGEERSEMKIGRALSLYCTKERERRLIAVESKGGYEDDSYTKKNQIQTRVAGMVGRVEMARE